MFNRNKGPQHQVRKTIFWVISLGIVTGLYGFIFEKESEDAFVFQIASIIITVIGLVWYQYDRKSSFAKKEQSEKVETKNKFKGY